ncbi:MAG: DNA double-strand break repair nuclease NurA [Thermoproteota archaeon]
MPNFIELIDLCLKNVSIPDPFLNYSKEMISLLEEETNRRIKKIDFGSENKFNFEFLAVDSSRAIRELMDGSSLGIFRAIGLTNNRKEFKELETEFFYHSGKSNQLIFYESAKMEYLEAKVILKYLSEEDTNNKFVLVDGSLFGRVSHIPIELQIYGKELFMIDYIKTYKDLFEEAERRKVLLVGISKDSRASFFKQLILEELIKKLVPDQNEFVRENDPSYLSDIISKIDNDETKSQLKIILNLYLRSVPDVYFLNRFSKLQKYFTLPVELSYDMISSKALIRMLENRSSDEDYIKTHFSKVSRNLSNELYSKLMLTLDNVRNYPTIVSFYLIPAKNDSPIRVDIPSYCLSVEHRLKDLVPSGFINLDEEKLNSIISSLLEQYAGYKNYNILLKRADEKVKLSNYIVDNVYLKVIERKLGVILLPGRDYRRVKLH